MRTGRHSIIWALLAGMLSLASIANGQQVYSGPYHGGDDEAVISLLLFSDSLFTFSKSDGLNVRSARGTWFSTRDSLILIFDVGFNPELPSWSVIKTDSTDASKLTIQLYSQQSGHQMPGAHILPVPSDGRTATITDVYGVATIPIESSFDHVSIGYMGYHRTRIPVRPFANQAVTLRVEMAPSSHDVVIICCDDECFDPKEIQDRWAFKTTLLPGGQYLFESDTDSWILYQH